MSETSETRTDVTQTLSPTEAARFLGIGLPRLAQLDGRLLPERDARNHRVYRRDALERYQAARTPWSMGQRLDELRQAAAVKGPKFEREFMAELERLLATLCEGGKMGRIDGHLEISAPIWECQAMAEQMIEAGQRTERAARYSQTGRTDAAKGEPDRFDGSKVTWPAGFDRTKAERVIAEGGPHFVVNLHRLYGKLLRDMSDVWVAGALEHVLLSQWTTESLEAVMQSCGYEKTAASGWRRVALTEEGPKFEPSRSDALMVNITEHDRKTAAWQMVAHKDHADYATIVESAAERIAFNRALREEMAKRFSK